MASSFIVTTADWSRGATLTWRRPGSLLSRCHELSRGREWLLTHCVTERSITSHLVTCHVSRVTCAPGGGQTATGGRVGGPAAVLLGPTAQHHSTTAPQHSTLNSTLRLGPAQHSTHVMTTRGWFQLHHTTSHNCEYSTAGLGLVARCGGR